MIGFWIGASVTAHVAVADIQSPEQATIKKKQMNENPDAWMWMETVVKSVTSGDQLVEVMTSRFQTRFRRIVFFLEFLSFDKPIACLEQLCRDFRLCA